MSELTSILVASWLAGLAAVAGGVVARIEGSTETETKRELIHGITAFGGGILVSAVAFALVPHGLAILNTTELTLTFCAGGVFFCVLDAFLSRRGGSRAQFMAMLMDYLPEAVSLGAVFGHDRRLGLLLAAFIGAQNLPEGFNSYREMRNRRMGPRSALAMLFAASLLGPAAAWIGFELLAERDVLTAAIMLFAGGGILYLVFQDIAPQAQLRRHWAPSMGAVLGFLVGLLGKKFLG